MFPAAFRSASRSTRSRNSRSRWPLHRAGGAGRQIHGDHQGVLLLRRPGYPGPSALYDHPDQLRRALVPRRVLGLVFRPRLLVVLARLYVVSGLAELGIAAAANFVGASLQFTPPEVVADQTVPIGADGTVAVPIDTALAKELHGDTNHRYEIRAEVVDQSRRTIVGSGEVLVARKPFDVFVWTDRGYYRAGDAIEAQFAAQTLDRKPVAGKGVVTLHRVTYERRQETDRNGRSDLDRRSRRTGAGPLADQGVRAGAISTGLQGDRRQAADDRRGRRLHHFGPRVRQREVPLQRPGADCRRREYKPGERVRLLINTNRSDSTVFLFLRPANEAYAKPQIVHLSGKSVVTEIDVAQGDMPNFFVEACTISDGRLFSETRRDHRSAGEAHRRRVSRAVGSRLQARLTRPTRIKLTDREGKPVRGSIVVSVYDKSVEYISGGIQRDRHSEVLLEFPPHA